MGKIHRCSICRLPTLPASASYNSRDLSSSQLQYSNCVRVDRFGIIRQGIREDVAQSEGCNVASESTTSLVKLTTSESSSFEASSEGGEVMIETHSSCLVLLVSVMSPPDLTTSRTLPLFERFTSPESTSAAAVDHDTTTLLRYLVNTLQVDEAGKFEISYAVPSGILLHPLLHLQSIKPSILKQEVVEKLSVRPRTTSGTSLVRMSVSLDHFHFPANIDTALDYSSVAPDDDDDSGLERLAFGSIHGSSINPALLTPGEDTEESFVRVSREIPGFSRDGELITVDESFEILPGKLDLFRNHWIYQRPDLFPQFQATVSTSRLLKPLIQTRTKKSSFSNKLVRRHKPEVLVAPPQTSPLLALPSLILLRIISLLNPAPDLTRFSFTCRAMRNFVIANGQPQFKELVRTLGWAMVPRRLEIIGLDGTRGVIGSSAVPWESASDHGDWMLFLSKALEPIRTFSKVEDFGSKLSASILSRRRVYVICLRMKEAFDMRFVPSSQTPFPQIQGSPIPDQSPIFYKTPQSSRTTLPPPSEVIVPRQVLSSPPVTPNKKKFIVARPSQLLPPKSPGFFSRMNRSQESLHSGRVAARPPSPLPTTEASVESPAVAAPELSSSQNVETAPSPIADTFQHLPTSPVGSIGARPELAESKEKKEGVGGKWLSKLGLKKSRS